VARNSSNLGPREACALVLFAALVCACEVTPPKNHARANPGEFDPYAAQRTSGGETPGAAAARHTSTLTDDEQIERMFPPLRGVRRMRTCAPANAAWAILVYQPEMLDAHRVRTRELHCSGRVLDDQCTLVSEVRYYLDDPREYFELGQRVSVERALQIARLTRNWPSEPHLVAIAAEKGGVYLVTLSECGAEKQLATRIKGAGAKQQLEVIETRHAIQL
jgi:hypothetical protein